MAVDSTYPSIQDTCGSVEATPVNETTKAEAISKIQSLYNDGVPLFTTEAILDVYQQLKTSSEKGQQISMQALDGNMVKFALDTGFTYKGSEPEVECV